MKNLILIFNSIFIFEKKALKKKLTLIEYFFKNINLINYYFFLFNKNKHNPIKSHKFQKYIELNKNKWAKEKINKLYSKNSILVEAFINHPAYILSNIVTSMYLNAIFKMNIVGLIRTHDLKSEVLFRSFGVRNFIYFKNPNIYERIYYLIKALRLIKTKKNFEGVYKLKYKNIDVGLTAYDSYIRYLGMPTLNKINSNYIVFFAEALYSCDYISKKIDLFKFKKTIQSETQFSPLNILFQLSLKNKIEVFSRLGLEKFTLRRYTSWKQRYSNRAMISQKTFNEVFKHCKKKSISIIKKNYQNKIKQKLFGVDEVVLGLSNKKTDLINKEKLLKTFKWKNKKIVVFFLSHLLDGNFNYGFRKNFKDIYSSTEFIIDRLKKLTKVNWIIKKHPNQDYYSSKFDFQKKIKILEKECDHIRLVPENIDSASLLKIADLALTISGSVGVEYPSFGVRSLFLEKSYYSNLNFLNYVKSKKQLIKYLQNAHKQKKISNTLIEKCQVYLFLKDILIKNQSTLIPEYIPSRKIDENKFWLDAARHVKKFKFSEDEFYTMLKKQIKYSLRHTLNYNMLKIPKKKYNDFTD